MGLCSHKVGTKGLEAWRQQLWCSDSALVLILTVYSMKNNF